MIIFPTQIVKIHHNLTAIVELDSILITIQHTYYTLFQFSNFNVVYTVYNVCGVYIRTVLMDGVGIITAINSVTMDEFYQFIILI